MRQFEKFYHRYFMVFLKYGGAVAMLIGIFFPYRPNTDRMFLGGAIMVALYWHSQIASWLGHTARRNSESIEKILKAIKEMK